MINESDSRRSPGDSGTIWPAIAAIAAVVGALGALLGGLAATGAFDDSRQTSADFNVEDLPPQSASTANDAVSDGIERLDRVSVTLAYSQSATGCNPVILVRIGDRSFEPSSLVYEAKDVQIGEQEYSIDGNVFCQSGASCVANGEGTVNIAQGESFDVVWEEIALGSCRISLQ